MAIFNRNKKSSIQAEFDDKITAQVEKTKSDYDKRLQTQRTVDASKVNIRKFSAETSLSKAKYRFLLLAARNRNATGYINAGIIKTDK